MNLSLRIQVKSKRKVKPAARLAKEYKDLVRNTLKRVGMKGVNNIRHEIKKRDLIDTGNMSHSTRYKLMPHGVRFTVDDPAPYLEKGIRRHTMKHLLNSKGPIPIKDATTGNLIFRWATKESMARGGWKHPGFKKGKGFMRKAVTKTREELTNDLNNIVKKIF